MPLACPCNRWVPRHTDPDLVLCSLGFGSVEMVEFFILARHHIITSPLPAQQIESMKAARQEGALHFVHNKVRGLQVCFTEECCKEQSRCSLAHSVHGSGCFGAKMIGSIS